MQREKRERETERKHTELMRMYTTNNLISLDNIYDAIQLKKKLVHKICQWNCASRCFISNGTIKYRIIRALNAIM